jgi:hypothetical protein
VETVVTAPALGAALFVFASVIVNRVEVGLASSVILLFALFDDGTLPVGV